jgi:N-methylhydantoinase B/oxoprolinase/acetone carboxylase alpha subunit/endogenous inhibitor of DNA gyrase (YacG/DUF329 family)
MRRWRKRTVGLSTYFVGGVTNCTVCGKMIPCDVWEVEVDGKLLPFCDETCERLYMEYWLPKYKKEYSNILIQTKAIKGSTTDVDIDIKTDPVTLTVIDNRLVNICKEMGTAMMTTAYSPVFSESGDLSCAIFDKNGQMISQAEFCPSQLGAIIFTMEWTIKEIGPENFEPGDVVIHNDPYRGGCHMPEHSVIKPIYYKGELFGFVANIAHVAEIGGMAPGGFVGDATEVFQEGLRLPPIKIMRRGKDVEDIWKIILSNHRTPKASWADFRAMIGSLHVAERRLIELLDEYGSCRKTNARGDLATPKW